MFKYTTFVNFFLQYLAKSILGFTVWKRRFVCDGRSRTSVCTRAITALIIKQINTFNLKQIHEKPDNGASMSRIAVKLHISQTTICTASHSCLESSCNFSTLKASEYLMQSRKTFFFLTDVDKWDNVILESAKLSAQIRVFVLTVCNVLESF